MFPFEWSVQQDRKWVIIKPISGWAVSSNVWYIHMMFQWTKKTYVLETFSYCRQKKRQLSVQTGHFYSPVKIVCSAGYQLSPGPPLNIVANCAHIKQRSRELKFLLITCNMYLNEIKLSKQCLEKLPLQRLTLMPQPCSTSSRGYRGPYLYTICLGGVTPISLQHLITWHHPTHLDWLVAISLINMDIGLRWTPPCGLGPTKYYF